jgi:hypothetical protein
MVGIIFISLLAVGGLVGNLVQKRFYKKVIKNNKKFYSDLRERDKLCPCGNKGIDELSYCSNEECLKHN